MNLRRLFAQALVRRLAYVLVALALAWCGVGRAQAQSATSCQGNAAGCTESQAYQACQAGLALAMSVQGVSTPNCRRYFSGSGTYFCEVYTYLPKNCGEVHAGARNSYQFVTPCPNGIDPNTGQCSLNCPGGYGEDPLNPGQCLDQQKCLAKPALGAGVSKGGGFAVCNNGCEFKPKAGGPQLEIRFGDGTKMTPATGWTPTGQPCGATTTPPPDTTKTQECKALPSGQTACAKPDGRHCYTATTGKQICWKPGEVGEKTDGPLVQKTNPGDTPIPPNTQLPSGDTLQQSGTPTTTTVTNNTTNTTTTTTTTNYTTTNGTNADGSSGGGDSGVPGDGSGDNGDDGDGDGVGSPGEGVGDLYAGNGDRTMGDAFEAFWTQAQQTPLVGKINNFFGNCGYGGSCPVWSYNGGEMMGEVTFSGLCSGALEALFNYGGWIVLAMGAFCAFRIAIY